MNDEDFVLDLSQEIVRPSRVRLAQLDHTDLALQLDAAALARGVEALHAARHASPSEQVRAVVAATLEIEVTR